MRIWIHREPVVWRIDPDQSCQHLQWGPFVGHGWQCVQSQGVVVGTGSSLPVVLQEGDTNASGGKSLAYLQPTVLPT